MKRTIYTALCDMAYRIDLSEKAWLENLAQTALEATAGVAVGVIACTFTHSKLSDRIVLRESTVAGGPEDWISQLQHQLDRLDARQRGALFPRAPLSCRASDLLSFFGLALDTFDPSLRVVAHELDDVWVVMGNTAQGHGTFLAMPLLHDEDAIDTESWQRFSVHLAEASRLRGLVHTFSSWREHTLNTWEHSRHVVPSGYDRHQTSRLWRGLLDGRYAIMEQHDGNEHLHLVLHLTPDDPRPPRQLTDREREVVTYAARGHDNATIAFELGIASPTVATHLGSALQRLKLANRSQLIVLYQQLVGEA